MIARFLSVWIVSVSLSFGAAAQPVATCTNCSTSVQQIIDAANKVRQLEQQIMLVEQTINYYQTLVTNTASLPARLFNDITGEIAHLQGLVRNASVLADQAKFMINNLGQPSGYGGSLQDIPLALTQETNALAHAMTQLGLAQQEASGLSAQCTTQAAAGDAGSSDAGGIKGTHQAGSTIAATAAQCAEIRFQVGQASASAMATASLRAADQQAMFDAATAAHLQSGVSAGCAALNGGGPISWLCSAPQSPSLASPSATAVIAAQPAPFPEGTSTPQTVSTWAPSANLGASSTADLAQQTAAANIAADQLASIQQAQDQYPAQQAALLQLQKQQQQQLQQTYGTTPCDIGPSYTGSIPAAAAQAGMTKCAANYDFTYTQPFTDSLGTHQWSTPSSWLNCSNFAASPYLFKFTGSVPCNTSYQNITTDGGTQVLALTYGLADAQAGHYQNQLENLDGSNSNPMPGEYYVEMVVKTTSNNCDSNAPAGQGCVYFDASTFSTAAGHPCYVSSDSEWDNQLTVIHQGVAPWNFNASGCADTGGGIGPLQNGGAANTSYNTYGWLVTADDVSNYGMCSYGAPGAVSGLSASDFINCLTMSTSGAGPSVFNDNLYMYIVAGPQSAGQGGSVWTLNSLTVDIQRITFWNCAAWPTQCYNNPVITSHP